MEVKVDKNENLRYLLVYDFSRPCNATRAARNVNAVYGQGFIVKRTVSSPVTVKEGNY
jgi:hypothetical protein